MQTFYYNLRFRFVRTKHWFKHMMHQREDHENNSVLWAGGGPCAVACDICGFSMYGMDRRQK